MKQEESLITLSVGKFKTIETLRQFFHNIANYKQILRREQRDLIMNKKQQDEEEEHFNFIKFLFSNPSTA